MGVRLGNGNWAVKTSKLLAYNDASGMFFNKEFDFTRATTATRVNKSGLIESVASNLPRIDFTGDTKGHLLLEPASTNLITNSDPASLSEIPSRSGITVETFTWPIGFLQNAIRFPGGTNTATNREGEMATGVDITISCFVIMDDGSEPKVGGSATESGVVQDFSLRANNVVVEKSTVKVVNLGNNVYKVSGLLSAARNSVTQQNSGVLQNSNYSGKAFRVGGMQIEQKSFATSYIPTSGSSVTRNAETCRDSGAAQDFNSTEGVLYFEIASLKTVGNFESIALSDGSNDNRHRFYFSDDSNEVVYQAQVSTSNQCFFKVTTSDITAFNKIALKYKQDDFALWINGTEAATDSSGNVPSLSELNFNSGNTFNNFEGKVREVRTYRTALTDSELTALTT